MNALHRMFEQNTDAVFGIDADGRIRFANSEFEKLLGYSREQISNASCAGILCGTDMHGNTFCGDHCPIPKSVDNQPPNGDFDLVVRRADGDSVLVNIGACYPPQLLREQAGRVNVFFSLRRITPRRLLQRMATAPIEGSVRSGIHGRGRLTGREKEILGLAAKGMKTGQIAGRLCLSTQTVRSHFKNIYPKIGVHTRTEAVVFALQHGLH